MNPLKKLIDDFKEKISKKVTQITKEVLEKILKNILNEITKPVLEKILKSLNGIKTNISETLVEITKSYLDKIRNSLNEKINIENPLNELIENQIKDFDEKIGNINSLEQTLKDKIGKFE